MQFNEVGIKKTQTCFMTKFGTGANKIFLTDNYLCGFVIQSVTYLCINMATFYL